MKKVLVLLLLSTSFSLASGPASAPCPVCGNPSAWTTKTKMEHGRVFHEYRCVMGHAHWVLVK